MPSDEKIARYRQIFDVLKDRIISGTYPVGELMPTEADICEEFGVSRYTVREALRQLIALCLVSRRQGSGTIVIRKEGQQRFVFAMQSLTELFQYALDTHFKVTAIETVILDAATAHDVGGRCGARWTVVSGLRSARPDAEPFCFTKSFIPRRLAWIVPELPGCVGPFYAHIEKCAKEPICAAEQQIRATKMTAEMAATLCVPKSEVALVMLRRYMSKKGTVIASYNWHVASKFSYRMALQRDGGH